MLLTVSLLGKLIKLVKEIRELDAAETLARLVKMTLQGNGYRVEKS